MSAALSVEDLAVQYGTRTVVRSVSFSLARGEIAALIGPNGAGKSTLCKAVCGLVPHAGRVTVAGATCHHRRDRLGLAYLPQLATYDPEFPITAGQVVDAGRRRFRSGWRRPSPHDRRTVADALARVGLSGMAGAPLRTLSGGQRQRVLLARALAQQADVLLLDEALSAVDAPGTDGLLDLLRSLAAEGRTLLVATHDLALARRRFDRCLAVNGRLMADGPPEEVLAPGVLDAVFGSAALACTG